MSKNDTKLRIDVREIIYSVHICKGSNFLEFFIIAKVGSYFFMFKYLLIGKTLVSF